MSKDNPNLRLLGSPVNLSYRGKKKDARNIRNRPRSALQNSCYNPDNQERFKRPFSADAKERSTSNRPFFKSYSSELLQPYNPSITTIKILPPTTELLQGNTSIERHSINRDNVSDYGSEDTFISLGTKIKAKAQSGTKPKTTSGKLKFLSKKTKKPMEPTNDKPNPGYGMEIKISERSFSPVPKNSSFFRDRALSPASKTGAYESYFIAIDSKKDANDLSGRVSFGNSSIHAEVEEAIDTYSRRLTLTRQQLSLVEEESPQDIESVPSQQMPSLSSENFLEEPKKDENVEDILTGRNTYILDKDDYPKVLNYDDNFNKSDNFNTRTYSSFYDDFRATSLDPYKNNIMSSTVVQTDSSSKDSGYPESGIHDEKSYKQDCPLQSNTLQKSNSYDKVEIPSKSLDNIQISCIKSYSKSFPPHKTQWAEPLNHSRLLYKDFFIKKEGHIALPPHNSPTSAGIANTASDACSSQVETNKNERANELEYPSYLVNSTTKAYTSKVIEDYRKELEAINNLHELTLKDLKTDAISPTPLNIDKMFELHSTQFESSESSQGSNNSTTDVALNKNNNMDSHNKDISKVSTKELIQNYLKVKGDYIKDFPSKTNKKDRKVSNFSAKVDSSLTKQDWNNKSALTTAKSPIPVSFRNQTHQKNMFTMRTPASARIEGVQNDKDVDSYMSLTAPSPRIIELSNDDEGSASTTKLTNENCEVQERSTDKRKPEPSTSTPIETIDDKEQQSKELNPDATVLDIYSMLKEIESFGDNPVTSVTNTDLLKTEAEKKTETEERQNTPKDNFMEIFEFLEKVEQSANDALSVVTTTTPNTMPKLEVLLKLPQTELAQRLVTASLQLEERSCCIALLQESLANNKEQMVNKVSNLERHSIRNISKVKQDCEEAIKRHQSFIDQLISDKKTLNHRIEQLVDERRSLEERWRRAAQAQEERYKLELRNQHDKMAAQQQVARQRWVRQKAEKIKELTVKGLEGELREMAERQQKEIADIKMYHAEQCGRYQARHAADIEELRNSLLKEKEEALVKERQMASARLEKQILELEVTYQEQRTRLVAEMRAENERVASSLTDKERLQRHEIEKWRHDQERLIEEKRQKLEQDIAREKEKLQDEMKIKQEELERKFEQYKREFEAEQNVILKRKVTEISAQHKLERDKEIEKAIESMEAEAQAGRRELQEALRRNKEQYEGELRELAETEQATLNRYKDAQARIRQTEDRCAEMEMSITQLETRNKILTEKNTQLEREISEVRARCDEAWQKTVNELKKGIEDSKKVHEEQMHQLYAKVKVAVARKDSAIQALTREAGKYKEKIAILEQKLQQQRKDFLKQK